MSVTRVGANNRLCLTSRASGRSEHQDVTLIKDQLAREMCGISEGRSSKKGQSGRPLLKFTIPL